MYSDITVFITEYYKIFFKYNIRDDKLNIVM